MKKLIAVLFLISSTAFSAARMTDASIASNAGIQFSKLEAPLVGDKTLNGNLTFKAGGASNAFTITNFSLNALAGNFINFWDNTNTNAIGIFAPASVTSTYDLKLPPAQGAAGSYQQNDGSGNLSWVLTTPANQALSTCTTARTVDWSTGNSFTLTLTSGNACTLTFSGAASGQHITLWLTNGGSGGTATVVWPTAKWFPAGAPVMTTGTAALDVCTCTYNGTSYGCNCLQNGG